MNIYLIERFDEVRLDEYESHVIVAVDENSAVGFAKWGDAKNPVVTVKLVGIAVSGVPAGILHSSFVAG